MPSQHDQDRVDLAASTRPRRLLFAVVVAIASALGGGTVGALVAFRLAPAASVVSSTPETFGSTSAVRPSFVAAATRVTIRVPEDVPGIAEAVSSIADWRISAGAFVDIRVAPGRYAISAPLVFAHPDGRRIGISAASAAPALHFVKVDSINRLANGSMTVIMRLKSTTSLSIDDWIRVTATEGSGSHEAFRGLFRIVGLEGEQVRLAYGSYSPTLADAQLTSAMIFKPAVQLVFTPTDTMTDYFAFDILTALGNISNVAILAATPTSRASGLRHGDGATLVTGTGGGDGGLSIGGWGRHCMWAFRNAQATVDGITVSGCRSGGIYASQGAQVEAVRGLASGTGIGFAAVDGGQITCSRCVATRSTTGFLAVAGGRVIAANARAVGGMEASTGYRAWPGGFIWAEGAVATYNGSGFAAEGGTLWIAGATASHNKVAFSDPPQPSLLQPGRQLPP